MHDVQTIDHDKQQQREQTRARQIRGLAEFYRNPDEGGAQVIDDLAECAVREGWQVSRFREELRKLGLTGASGGRGAYGGRRLINARYLAELLGYSERALWPALPRLEARGFPPRIRLTERTARWDLDQVEAWLAALEAA
ncbi:MAG: hypothetical protein RLO50_14445 [Azospirillaceae bacterium]